MPPEIERSRPPGGKRRPSAPTTDVESTTACLLCDRPKGATYRGLPDRVSQGTHDSCWALRYGMDPYGYLLERHRDSVDDPREQYPCRECGETFARKECNGLCQYCWLVATTKQLRNYRGKPLPPELRVLQGGRP
jgi:hypothetical protein